VSAVQTWLLASRPKTVAASVAPVLIGTAMAVADGAFHAVAFLCAFGGALLIQIGTNFANDYFDFVKGADTEDRLGPTRATQAGLIRPETMRLAFIVVFAAALPLGAVLIYRAGWPLMVVGLASIAAGILYTGGPRPLGYLGLGDLFVLVFFGPVAVGGTYYVQALTLPPEVLIAGLAPGLLSVSMLAVNNLRDVDTDRVAGKRTLAVRLGPTFARVEVVVSILLALAIPLLLVDLTGGHLPALAATAVILPALPVMRRVWMNSGTALNRSLGETGRLLILFSVLFFVGWML